MIEQTGPSEPVELEAAAPRRRLRAGDLALAVGTGLVAAVSPLTSREPVVSAIAGLVVASGVLVYLRRRGEDGAATGTARHLPATDLLAFGAILVGYAVALAPTFAKLGTHWTSSLWSNGHGVFMPPAIAYLGWRALRELPDEPARPSAWGFVLFVPALMLVALGQTAGSLLLATLGFVSSLPGISLLLLGRRGTRALLVPLALALLMVPIPNVVSSHMHLRHVTASVVGGLYSAMGFLSFRDGTVIQTPDLIFVVADACSGFSTLYASVSVALILGAMAGSLRATLLLLAASLPLAMGANILRVLGLVVATDLLGVWVLESPLHPGSGMATFFISLGGLMWIHGRWRRRSPA